MQKKTSYRHFVTDFSRRMLLLFVFTIFVYTVNWFIPFRSDLIKVSDNERTEFSFDELSMDTLDLYKELRARYPEVSKQVVQDIDESYRRAEALYESEVSSKLEETFSETTGKIADKGWEIQGEVLKENTYDGLTLMLLQYYIDE